MKTQIGYRFEQSTITVPEGVRKIFEVPPREFLDRLIKPVVDVHVGGITKRLDYGQHEIIGLDYEKFDELVGPHARKSFTNRRAALTTLKVQNPMAEEIFSYGVPRLVQEELNGYMGDLAKFVTLTSTPFYRGGNPAKGMTDAKTKKNTENLVYVRDYFGHLPHMVHINCFYKHKRTGFFYPMTYENQYDTLKMIFKVKKPTIVYCWCHAAALQLDNPERLGPDLEGNTWTTPSVNTFLSEFIDNTIEICAELEDE